MASQGIWFEQYAKVIEILVTIFMIGIVIIPKPILNYTDGLEKKLVIDYY